MTTSLNTIIRSLKVKILRWPALIAAALLVAPAYAEEFFLASMAPTVKIEKLTGKGTAQAIAEGFVPESEMQASCEGLAHEVTDSYMKDCMTDMRKQYGQPFRASADCIAGTMRPAIGGNYKFAGLYTPAEAFGDKNITKWQDDKGEIEPVARATNAYALDQNWKVLCGEDAHPGKSAWAVRPARFDPEIFGGMTYDHNGSLVRVNDEIGEIRYEDPKKSIAGTVTPGTLLFKGTFRNLAKPNEAVRGVVEGTAYVFKKGCQPASYHVQGTYDTWTITLKGPAPKRDRNSCEVQDVTSASRHSVLRFEALGDY
ncbi:hypothetical protein [Microvirga pakistanensis]|uniref:hypothetical protein n=1 Tax=Microvirga pakistanensis TaxID=1682650 RepID=UPI00106BE9B0|nr:hypothetical protein [Microvirga pakistanensis]